MFIACLCGHVESSYKYTTTLLADLINRCQYENLRIRLTGLGEVRRGSYLYAYLFSLFSYSPPSSLVQVAFIAS